MPTKVLVVEDDKDIANLVIHYLDAEGFEVTVVADGVTALKRLSSVPFDLVILDLMLPGLGGLEVCKRLRADRKTAELPIIMVTAKGDESDRVVGLELGADDYLPKPFSPKELVARVKALLRRSHRAAAPPNRFRYRTLELDVDRHEVTVHGKEARLTAKEFSLLKHLLENPGRVLTREVLLDRVWGYDADVTTRTVDVHVRRLREKIPLLAEAIETVKSFGYKLVDKD